ncbi:STAS domain-containing protein [Oceanobacillus caeni]|uniref:Anti-sigma factor antagonist n=1 Tax=Oceanobacillus caeni TaxID=405946 RepID=A0ABR5MJD2_9BACI|nr:MULTISPECIES: STAS domain-containing protein [Bacillaceae]KKE80722.1 anti-sigma-factor antagonist [Bacilli bacterium VT-13-104]PZD83329.1 anti-sigma factor antagonist [Bacilli bacterium]KPH75628.1 anti-sigma-factor antagonist [Oceanobacillus caeni]MBU8792236.1 STAS domain-containing protein [Oceanobacillus caeni]MCR1835643.1 STAS domain-containing protein [Oceanobacillus caeni]
MELNIDIVEERNKSVVRLSGEIDVYTAPQLKEKLLPLTKMTGNEVEVDMEFVSYMDSTGLGVFISALKSSNENSSKLKMINLSDRVYRVFNITGLHEIMDLERINKVER